MLRPARLLGRLTSPRRRCTLTGPPVYGRACSNRSLPKPESASTTRPNHLLPRRDSHPFIYQRTKAAPEGNKQNEDEEILPACLWCVRRHDGEPCGRSCGKIWREQGPGGTGPYRLRV